MLTMSTRERPKISPALEKENAERIFEKTFARGLYVTTWTVRVSVDPVTVPAAGEDYIRAAILTGPAC